MPGTTHDSNGRQARLASRAMALGRRRGFRAGSSEMIKIYCTKGSTLALGRWLKQTCARHGGARAMDQSTDESAPRFMAGPVPGPACFRTRKDFGLWRAVGSHGDPLACPEARLGRRHFLDSIKSPKHGPAGMARPRFCAAEQRQGWSSVGRPVRARRERSPLSGRLASSCSPSSSSFARALGLVVLFVRASRDAAGERVSEQRAIIPDKRF